MNFFFHIIGVPPQKQNQPILFICKKKKPPNNVLVSVVDSETTLCPTSFSSPVANGGGRIFTRSIFVARACWRSVITTRGFGRKAPNEPKKSKVALFLSALLLSVRCVSLTAESQLLQQCRQRTRTAKNATAPAKRAVPRRGQTSRSLHRRQRTCQADVAHAPRQRRSQ